MKHYFLLIALVFNITCNAQVFEWAKTFGSVSFDSPREIIVDDSGNIYTAGNFRDTVDFDPDTTINNYVSNGSSDAFVQKLDSTSNFIWAKAFGGSGEEVLEAFTLDTAGNLYTAGHFEGTVDFDPGPGIVNHTTPGNRGTFIQKLDTAGNFIWVQTINAGTGNQIMAHSITTDAQGNLYIVGSFSGTVDFDPGPGISLHTGPFNLASYILKLSPLGDFIWVKTYSNFSWYHISVNADLWGNIYVTGNFSGAVDFDPSVNVDSITSNGNWDPFILKLDTAGNYQWTKTFGGSVEDRATSSAIDSFGNIYTTGFYEGTVDFDPGSGIDNHTSSNNEYIFIQKLDSSGNFIWAKTCNGYTNDGIAYSIAVDLAGYIYTTGSFRGVIDLYPDTTINNYHSNGSTDAFILKLDPAGNFVWGRSFGSSGVDWGSDITVSPSGNIHTTGIFHNSADFDPGSYTNYHTSNGSYDIFIQKLSPCQPIFATDIQVACDSLLWIDGITYTSPNNSAMHTLSDVNGCDSIVTLDLTIINATSSTDQITTCDSLTWIDGVTYTTSNNTAQHTLINAAGCDSVVSLDLTILSSSFSVDSQSACDSITWLDGITYTSSNNSATYTVTNSIGCDSIITLDLTINSTFTTDVQYACDSLTWIDGITYTTSNNSATQTLTNALGCDSLVTLDLTILSNTATDIISTCDSLTWINGVTYTTSNNTATHTLTNAAGCDSVVTLDLTINYSNSGTDVITACDSLTWIDGITYTASNNTATHTLANAAGCDSVVTLDLTVNHSNGDTDVITTCDSYTWIDGITYTASNNTATHALTNTAGCDSVVTLDLTITYTNTGTDVITACDSLTWIDGITYTTSNNTATHTLTNAAGCDSVISLDLTIDTVSDITTSLVDTTITANNVLAAYQWIDCDNNIFITGETNQSFTATANGNYAVELTENGCVDTSNCVAITTVGIIENTFGNNLMVYPNPTDGQFSIDLGKMYQEVKITITNINGRVIQSYNYSSNQLINMVLEEAAGIYLIYIESEDKKAVVRLVVN